jgi:hypothetical protein
LFWGAEDGFQALVGQVAKHARQQQELWGVVTTPAVAISAIIVGHGFSCQPINQLTSDMYDPPLVGLPSLAEAHCRAAAD